MRSAKIGWATCLLLGGVAVSLSGCLTKDRVVRVAGATSVKNVDRYPVHKFLAESDYGTSDSKIEAAVDADGMFYFDQISTADEEAVDAQSTPVNFYDVKEVYASQGAKRANVDFSDDVNVLQFLDVKSTTVVTRNDADDGNFNKVTHTEMAEHAIPLSKLTGLPMDIEDDKDSEAYGRKGTRYSVLHNLPNGHAIALFATESKYLKDYGTDDEDAEMFAGGYWVEISQDADEENNVVNAGVFSDAEKLVRGDGGLWALQYNNDYTQIQDLTASPFDAEVTAKYSGKTEGGYSDKNGAGGFSGDIELTAKLFGENATARVGTGPDAEDFVDASAGTVDGTIKGIKLYTFQDFGKDPESLSGTVKLGSAPISEMGTMNGSVMIGTASKGKWSGIFSNTTVNLNAPAYVLGTYGFEHSQGSGNSAIERAFLGHFGLAHPDVDTD